MRKTTAYVCLAGVLLVYLATRLFHLMSIPMFLDEAIHIEFGKMAMTGKPLIGVNFGKFLSIYSYGLVMKVFNDSLLYARLVPAAIGLLTIVLIFVIGREIHGRSGIIPALFASLVYVFAPYSLFYDCVALTDQFLTVLLALIILFTFRTAKRNSRFEQVILALVIMLSPMFKYNGLLFALFPIFIAVLIAEQGKIRKQLRNFAFPYAISIPVIAIFAIFYAPGADSDKLASYHSLSAAMRLAGANAGDTFSLFSTMFTPSLFAGLVTGGLAVLFLPGEILPKRRVQAFVLIIAILILPYVILFRTWYPRYYLPFLVPFCLIGGEAVSLILNRVAQPRKPGKAMLMCSLLLLIIAHAGAVSFYMLNSPRMFPYFKSIGDQFITGWTSGYGLNDAVRKIHRLSNDNPGGISILCSPYLDLPLLGINVFHRELSGGAQRIILRKWTPGAISPELSKILAGGKPAYLLFNSAFPYQYDQMVIEEIRNSFNIYEEAHFIKPYANPGLKIWRLSEKNTLPPV